MFKGHRAEITFFLLPLVRGKKIDNLHMNLLFSLKKKKVMHVGNFLFTHFTKGDQHWVVLTLFLQRQDRDIDICSNGIIQNTVK